MERILCSRTSRWNWNGKIQRTDKFYVTARKASISSTFDELTCQALIGTELPGKVEKVNCEPYEYTIKDTGEVIVLTHRFDYVEEEKLATLKWRKAKQLLMNLWAILQEAPVFWSIATLILSKISSIRKTWWLICIEDISIFQLPKYS
jgi:hypothetical protein